MSTTIRVIVAPLITQCSQTIVCSAVSGARMCISRVMSTAECRCLFTRTDMQLRHVHVKCMRFLAYLLCFHCLNTTTLFNTDVKKHVFVPSLPSALLLFCAFAVVNLSSCNTCSRYFSLHFLM